MGSIIGLDLSLTGAGVAIIREEVADPALSARSRFEVHRYGYGLKADATLLDRGQRINHTANKVVSEVLRSSPELVMIEDMPYGATGAGTIDRGALWWRVVIDLQVMQVPIVQVNVSSLKIYATGKGNKIGKDEVMLAIARRYPDAPISSNDEADAFGLAAMGARLLGRPLEESLPQTHLRAMEKVKLP